MPEWSLGCLARQFRVAESRLLFLMARSLIAAFVFNFTQDLALQTRWTALSLRDARRQPARCKGEAYGHGKVNRRCLQHVSAFACEVRAGQ